MRTKKVELSDTEVQACIEMLLDIYDKFAAFGRTREIRACLGTRWTKILRGRERPGRFFYELTYQIWREHKCGDSLCLG